MSFGQHISHLCIQSGRTLEFQEQEYLKPQLKYCNVGQMPPQGQTANNGEMRYKRDLWILLEKQEKEMIVN